MRTVALVLVSVLLAACVSPEPVEEGPLGPVPSTDSILTVHGFDARALDIDAYPGVVPLFNASYVPHRAAEPTIAPTRDGAIYAAVDYNVSGYQPSDPNWRQLGLYRTTDSGATWKDVSPSVADRSYPLTSIDPYVYTDPITWRTFSIDLEVVGVGVCMWLSWTDDAGDNWLTNPATCGSALPDHQHLFTGKPVGVQTVGYPNVVYVCYNQYLATTSCARSLNGGLAFESAVPVFVEQRGDGRLVSSSCGQTATGQGTTSPVDGTVYLGHVACDQALVSISRDSGLTWTTRVVDETEGGSPDMVDYHEGNVAVDQAGNVYYVWIAKDGLPKLSISRDQGQTWSPPRTVSAPGVAATRFPSNAAAAEGTLTMLYLGTDTEDALTASNEDLEAATWNAYVTTTLNALDEDPVFATTTVNAPGDPVRRGPCKVRCAEGSDAMYDFLDIQVNQETGQIWAALVDICNAACAEGGGGSYGSPGLVGVQVGGTRLLR